jgi:hypothetical protein
MDPNNKYELNCGSDVVLFQFCIVLFQPTFLSLVIWHDFLLYHKSFQSVSEVKISCFEVFFVTHYLHLQKINSFFWAKDDGSRKII